MPVRTGKSPKYKPKSPGAFSGKWATDSVESHLVILDLFARILKYIRKNGEESLHNSISKDKHLTWPFHIFRPVRVKAFLVSAEARYVNYLDLISKETGEDILPLPPWDVAMIFHSHMLSPLRFEADIGRSRWKLDIKRMAFPLERLRTLITNEIWSDPQSQQLWESAYPSIPYQILDSFPDSDPTILPYRNIEGVFICPNCRSCPVLEFNAWATFRLRLQDGPNGTPDNGKLRPPCCSALLDFEKVSDLNLINDLRLYDGTPESISSYIEVLHPLLSSQKERNSLVELIRDSKVCQDRTPGGVGEKTLESFVNRVKLEASQFRERYQLTPWPDFSYDLVTAVELQEKFMEKIFKKPTSKFQNSEEQYLKFMYLLKKTTSTLVPSLEIDLFWHTHQLFGIEYHRFCLDNIGRRINHDSALDVQGVINGLFETKRAWHNVYGEVYAVEQHIPGTFISRLYPDPEYPKYRDIQDKVQISEDVSTWTNMEINKYFDQARIELDKLFLQDLEYLCQIHEPLKAEQEELRRLEFAIENTRLSFTSRLLSQLRNKSCNRETIKRSNDLSHVSLSLNRIYTPLCNVEREIRNYRMTTHNYGADKIEHARLTTFLEKSNSKMEAEQLASDSPFASAWLEETVRERGYPWAKRWQSIYVGYQSWRSQLPHDRYAAGPPPPSPVARDDHWMHEIGGVGGGGCCGCG